MKSQQHGSDFLKGKLLVIVGGPTCSGKTRLSIELAQKFSTEIVSADSRQFYSEMNIGTAKPTAEELETVRHHFIGNISVQQHWNASTYAEQAVPLLHQLFSGHNVVIMVGGSGLYIDSVIFGIDDLPPANEKIRELLESVRKKEGMNGLRELLQQKDPDGFNRIDIHNPRRVIRALEVTLETGTPYSSLLGKRQSAFPWKWIMTTMDIERETLYQRINERTAGMIRQGLREEVESLLPFRHNRALQTVGYREMFEHLDGTISLPETEELISRNTRNYAKRQVTWFKKYDAAFSTPPGDSSRLVEHIEKSLEKS